MPMFLLFMFFDTLFYLPFAWLKAVIGLGTGLFIRRKTVGLLACLLGDGLIYVVAYVFARLAGRTISSGGSTVTPVIPDNLIERIRYDLDSLLVISIIVFNGVFWWVVGRMLRWGFVRIRARWMPAKSAP